MVLGSTPPIIEMNTRNLSWGKGLPARKADNLTATCELTVEKMWEPRHLITLWASTACYKDSFIHWTKPSPHSLMELSILEKQPIVQPVKNFPTFYGTRRFITAFTRSSTGPYPEPDRSDPIHTIPSYLSKINFNIVHPLTSWSSQWSLSFWISHQYPTCIPLLPHSYYMPCLSHPPWFDHSNYAWRRV
jgi:hypothetical protein